MKIFLEILTFTLHNTYENRIFYGLSGRFRLGSRMFLVCFSFLLRSNWLPIRLELGLFLVRNISLIFVNAVYENHGQFSFCIQRFFTERILIQFLRYYVCGSGNLNYSFIAVFFFPNINAITTHTTNILIAIPAPSASTAVYLT